MVQYYYVYELIKIDKRYLTLYIQTLKINHIDKRIKLI